jgi:hypothetical protein
VRDRHLEQPLTPTAGSAAALGFAPHSGWAVLVAVGLEDAKEAKDPAPRPAVLLRQRIEMADSTEPGSKQPYHAVEKRPIAEAAARIATFEKSAARLAHEGLSVVLGVLERAGRVVSRVGILDSAGRRGVSLAATLASHALIHTADGDHFRNALATAAETCGLPVTRVRARELETRAAAALGRSPYGLREILRGLRRETGSPWDADHRAAALLGWLLLVESAGGR